MEKDFAGKLRLEQPAPWSPRDPAPRPSFAFRAPQENFTIHDFQLGKLYGIGSYSKVVRAKKKDTGHVYALKVMSKDFITRENKVPYVKLERLVLDQLDHPGIIRLYFTFQDTCSLYMALESCEGGELFDQIVSKGRLSEDEARFYTAEIVDVLEYLHGLGLIHRDIKPENLLLTVEGHIKIADFGSIKPTADSCLIIPSYALNENASTFVGTAGYVPPEVLNSSPATYGNDLWALGCTLYQMLSGAPPFLDTSEWLVFQRITARDLRFPDYFSDEASDLIEKLLDIDPSRRLGSGPDGYAALKIHPFFKGIDWKTLRKQTAPKLSMDMHASENTAAWDSTWNHTDIAGGRTSQHATLDSGSLSSSEAESHLSGFTKADSLGCKWQEFLEPDESVLMISKLKRLRKIKSKKVLLILTDKAKLICVNRSKLMGKGKIIWHGKPSDLNVHVANASNFKVSTPNKVMSFGDSKQQAWQWKLAVESLQKQ